MSDLVPEWDYSTETEVAETLYGISRAYRRDVRISWSHRGLRRLVNGALRLPTARASLRGRPRPSLSIWHDLRDDEGTALRGAVVGSAIILDSRNAGPLTALHEVAHVLAEGDDGHGYAWSATYIKLIGEAYGVSLTETRREFK